MKTLLAYAIAAVTIIALAPTQLNAQLNSQDTINKILQTPEGKIPPWQRSQPSNIGDQFEKQMQQNNRPGLQNKTKPTQTAPNNQINSMSRNVK